MKRNRVLVAILIGVLFLGNGALFLSNSERTPKLYSNSMGSKYKEPSEKALALNTDDKKKNQEKTTKTNDKNSLKKSKKKKYAENGNEINKTRDTKDYNSKGASDEGSGGSSSNSSGKAGNGKPGNVSQKKLSSISYSWTGSDELLYGKNIDYSKITVIARYSNGDTETIPTGKYKIQGFNSEKLGSATCKITYQGVSTNATYKIINWEKELICASWSLADNYKYSATFKKSDIDVQVKMADGSRETVASNKFTVSGMDTKQLGTFTATIGYKGLTTTHKYTVHNYAKRIKSDISKFVVRGQVAWKDIVDGYKIKAVMADGSERDLSPSDYNVSGYSIENAGVNTATIKYEDASYTISYTVYKDMIRVVVPNIDSINAKIEFTDKVKVTSINSFNLPNKYLSEEDNVHYTLKGLYMDKGCRNSVSYPLEYTALPAFKVGSDGLENHEFLLYAKYEED